MTTTTASFKIPPIWGATQPFHSWKHEVGVWALLTDLPKEKRGLAVALSLTERRREVAMELTPEVLGSETGLTQLLPKLEAIFAKHSIDIVFESYHQFERIQRTDCQSVENYIQAFERCYAKIPQCKMTLPDDELACKLLCGANLEAKERQMVLATTPDLKFSTMRSSLKRIFTTSTAQSTTESIGDVKAEPAFVTDTSQGSAFWANGRGRPQNRRKGYYDQRRKLEPGTNPKDSSGKMTTCSVCGSRYHWRRDCPEKEGPAAKKTVQTSDNVKADEENNAVYLTFAIDCTKLLSEYSWSAILDSACTKTVAGLKWLSSYLENLSEEFQDLVEEKETDSVIMFGDGNR